MAGSRIHSVEINTAKSWENALSYSALIGAIPSSFTSTIRSLIVDHLRNNGSLSASSLYQVSRLLRGPSTSAMLYYAAKTFREEELQRLDKIHTKALIKLFGPFDLAAIIAVIYL